MKHEEDRVIRDPGPRIVHKQKYEKQFQEKQVKLRIVAQKKAGFKKTGPESKRNLPLIEEDNNTDNQVEEDDVEEESPLKL